MKKLFRDFLWSRAKNGGKSHHVTGSRYSNLPIFYGGLGIGNIKVRNQTLFFKWIWRYLTEKRIPLEKSHHMKLQKEEQTLGKALTHPDTMVHGHLSPSWLSKSKVEHLENLAEGTTSVSGMII